MGTIVSPATWALQAARTRRQLLPHAAGPGQGRASPDRVPPALRLVRLFKHGAEIQPLTPTCAPTEGT